MSVSERPLKKRKKRLKARPKPPDASMDHPQEDDIISEPKVVLTPRLKDEEAKMDNHIPNQKVHSNIQVNPMLIIEDESKNDGDTSESMGDKDPEKPEEVSDSSNILLTQKIQTLEKERETLQSRVRVAEANAEALRASPMRNVGRASDLAANRIVELGKRVRELREELNRAEERARSAESRAARGVGAFGDGPRDSAELVELQEKLAAANSRLYETRNQVQHLKQELNKAHKALISEVGEGIGLQGALSPGWRGRAQQILALQQKVSELQEKLTSSADSKAATVAQVSARLSERSKEVELARELESVKADLEETFRKLDFSKGRIKTITQDCTNLRVKNESLVERTTQDQFLVAQLKVQLAEAQEKAREAESLVAKRVEQQIENLKKELSQEKSKNEDLKHTITERDTKILSLQAKLYPNLHRNQKVSSASPASTAASSEKSLSEQTLSERPTVERPMSERQSLEKLEHRPLSRGLSASAAQLPTADKEESRQNTLAAIEAERLRLMELLAINNRRLEEERDTHDKTQQQLRSERHRCARLETKVARLELERVGWSKGIYRKPPGVNSMKVSLERSSEEWDVLKDRSELLEEKCLALESRVKCLQQEKEEDSRRFLKLLEETRAPFIEHKKKTT